jgi:hypothetical protein
MNGPGHSGSPLQEYEGRSRAYERYCGHYGYPELVAECSGLGMTGCWGHHAPVLEAPRSPGELTPTDVRRHGERLSSGNLLETGWQAWVNTEIGH